MAGGKNRGGVEWGVEPNHEERGGEDPYPRPEVQDTRT